VVLEGRRGEGGRGDGGGKGMTWHDGEPSGVGAFSRLDGVLERDRGNQSRLSARATFPLLGLMTIIDAALEWSSGGSAASGGAPPLASARLVALAVIAKATSHIGASHVNVIQPQAVEGKAYEVR
jgi:hypothetical protein